MLNVIVAPREDCHCAEKKAMKIVKYLKSEQIEYSVYFSQTYDKIKDNIKELISFGEYEFVVVGGDRVISSVIACFKDLSKIRLGIIPVGKNDDFANYLGLSSNPIQAIKDILNKQIEAIDVMVVNNMAVLNNVVVGASVDVLDRFNQPKIFDFISEKIALAKQASKFEGIELVLENKGKAKKENIFELVIANGGLLKGKMVSPLSNLQDGLFNVNYSIVSNKPEKKKYLRMLKNGNHIYDGDTKQHWLNSLKITNPDKKIKAFVDGKTYNYEELSISIIEKGLKIYKSKR